MQLSDFDYHLPAAQIAQVPLASRTASRLLVLTEATTQHRSFNDLLQLLRPGDLLVINDTAVIKARLFAHKDTGGRAEVLLERITARCRALCQVRSSKPLRATTTLLVGTARLKVIGREGQFYLLEFPEPVTEFLQRNGEVPLPPYISAPQGTGEDAPEQRYQTVYARQPGAVAAPTAGLHFSSELLDQVRAKGVEVAALTLHVGAGTFQPVRVDDVRSHQMHSERFSVPAATLAAVAACQGRVVAVGTTVVRALETAAQAGAFVRGDRTSEAVKMTAETRLFITPGFRFQAVDALLTNFHLPKSTLLMLVCACAGQARVMAAYVEAVAKGYRFFSYGDAMFIPNFCRESD
jgi:S-adenosylmethionine:tRNA ribosyltransferase-isomerase